MSSTASSSMGKKRSRRTKAKGRSKSRKRRTSPRIHLSTDAVLDIVGYLTVFIALLTLLALLSSRRGALLGPWVRLLERIFGWGVYVVPFLAGAIGLYLILRRFGDRVPRPRPEQVVGVVLLFFAFLATAHFPATWATGLSLEGAAQSGYGGGSLGAAIDRALLHGLGGVGTALALFATWLLGIFFTFNISPADMVRYLLALRERLPRPSPRLPTPPVERPIRPLSRPETPPVGVRPAVVPVKPKAPTSPSSPAPRPSPEDFLVPTVGGPPWSLPPIEAILEPGNEQDLDEEIVRQQARIIEETLASLGAPVKVKEVNRGPVITQFGVEPLFVTNSRGKQTRVKVSKIASLADDLALALAAKTIRIQTPIPKKGLVGIEVPNQEVALVALRDIIESEAWERVDSTLRLALGQDVAGQPFVADLRAMPHLLIAGATGSGKSVCINAILAALLLQNTPDDLKLLLVDPKRVELTPFNDIPHLLAPVVVDMERVTGVLSWVLREMDGRYRRFASVGARDIEDYNERVVPRQADLKRMPYIVVIVDELADLMMLAPAETERSLCRLAQMARATGIHLIIATQRPSVDVVTGLIKANFPARIAFAVASSVDSRVILDMPGAERLLGRGDMLFMSPDTSEPIRLQGSFVSDEELRRLIRYWKRGRELTVEAPASLSTTAQPVQLPLDESLVPEPAVAFEDDLLPNALEVILAENRASISLLQRRLRIGYTRSARIIDLLEEKGIVGPPQPGGQTREVNRAAAEALLREAGKEWNTPSIN
ncbi:MAG TPA: DNA translocase FtsK [Chloroflexi bacterium]|nr:DNA translocase FtsK [Chloroflexota bacterium]